MINTTTSLSKLLASAMIALSFSGFAQADPLPITIEADGPGALTSSWTIGQAQSVLAVDGARLLSGATVVARDDCSVAYNLLTFINPSFIRYQDLDGQVMLSAQTLTGDPESIHGLNVSLEMRAIDGPGVLRGFATLENPTAGPISVTARPVNNLSFQPLFTTSSGDAVFGTDDRWAIAGGAINCNGLPATVDSMAFFGPGSPAATPVFSNLFNDIYEVHYDLTITAGDTVHLMWFIRMHEDTTSAVNDVGIFDILDSSSVLLAGLSNEQLDNTLNWDIETPPVYACEGFDSPMDRLVTVKKNRALPLKATLLDSFEVVLTDLDLLSPPVVQVLFDSGVPGDTPVDVTDDALPSGQSSDGNVFSFDDSTDRWKYNLKTKNYDAPGTYTITMESGDESEYLVDPTCTATFVVE